VFDTLIVTVPAVFDTPPEQTTVHCVDVPLPTVAYTILPTFNLLFVRVRTYSAAAAVVKDSVVINPIAALHVTAALAAVAVTTPSLLVGNTNEDFVILL